jgi:hypothetical protein
MPIFFWCSHEDVNSYVMLTRNRLASPWAKLDDGSDVDLGSTVLKDCMTCELRPACEDPLPPFASQLLSFGNAVLRFLKSGMLKTDRETYDTRIAACLACPRLSAEGRCAHCGCWVSEKALWETEECPEQRWSTHESLDPQAEVRATANLDHPKDLPELPDSG